MALVTNEIIQDNGVVMAPTPEIPLVPTSPNGMTDLLNTAQTAQAQQLGVDPSGMAFINQQKAANLPQTEIGSQGIASLFPGMKHNINVGTYGGSIVGSNPIFVPGGNIMAIDPVLEKRKLEEAARIKAAQDSAKNADFTLRKPKQLQDKFYQESINKEANALNQEFINVARDIYGEDYKEVIKNPQMFDIGRDYLERFDALDLLVDQGDQITTVLADMETQSDKGTQVYDAETWKLKKEIESAINGDVKNLVGLRAKMQELQGGKNFDEYLNKQGVLDGIQGEILGGTSIKPSEFEGYATLSTSDKTKFDKNIQNLLDFYMSNNSPFAEEISKGLITRDMMEKRLRGSLQNKSQSKSTIANVSPKDSDSGSGTKLKDLDNIDGAPNPKIINNQQYDMNGELILMTKKNGVLKTSGLTSINPDGTEEKINGIVEVVPVSMNALNNTESIVTAEGGVASGGAGVKQTGRTPVMVARVTTYEIDEDSGKTVPVTVDKVLKLDETLIKATEANRDNLGYEEGVIEQGAKKIVGQSKKNSTLAPSNNDPLGLGI